MIGTDNSQHCPSCGRHNSRCPGHTFDPDEVSTVVRLAVAMVVVTILFMAIVVWLAT